MSPDDSTKKIPPVNGDARDKDDAPRILKIPAQSAVPDSNAIPYAPDLELIKRFFRAVLIPGMTTEIRIFKAQVNRRTKFIVPADKGTISGFFQRKDIDLLALHLKALSGVAAYWTINSVHKDFRMAPGAQTLISSWDGGQSVNDKEIISLENIPLDIDSIKQTPVKEISATDEEMSHAMDMVDRIFADYPEIRECSIWGCSGNGGWIDIKLPGLTPNAENIGNVARFTDWMASRYKAEHAAVDLKTKNPSRISPIPGTWKCKGVDFPGERPWRMVTMDSPVDHARKDFDLAGFLAKYKVPALPTAASDVVARSAMGCLPFEDGSENHASKFPPHVVRRRAESYVALMAPAIQNQGGSDQTYSVAAVAYVDFGLDYHDTMDALKTYNLRCQPPWSEAQLGHKIDSVVKNSAGKVRGRRLLEQAKDAGGFGLPSSVPKFDLDEPDEEPVDPRMFRARFQTLLAGDRMEILSDEDFLMSLGRLASENMVEYRSTMEAIKSKLKFPMKFVEDLIKDIRKKSKAKKDEDKPPAPPAIEDGAPKLPDDGRPTINVHDVYLNDIRAEVVDAMTTNNDPPEVFSSSNRLAWVTRDQTKSGRPFIEIMETGSIRGRMADIANFIEIRTVRGKLSVLKVAPPMFVVEDINRMKSYPEKMAPPVEQVVGTPRFVGKGRLLSEPGYDAESRIYYDPIYGLDIGAIPEVPSEFDVKAAVHFLTGEFLVDFPFESGASLANALGCMILPFVRDMIHGQTPMHSFDSSTPGIGKTKLAKCCAFASLGEWIPSSAQSEDDAEWRKSITSYLMSGSTHIFIDNINNLNSYSQASMAIDSGILAKAITDSSWKDRILGGNKTGTFPINVTWMCTGNNITWSNELVRRIVPIQIVTPVQDPSRRVGFKHPNLERWAEQNHSAIVRACLIICRNWIAKGQPDGTATNGSYEDYARIMGGILDAAGVPGFLTNLEQCREDSSDINPWPALVAKWLTIKGETVVTVAMLHEMIVGTRTMGHWREEYTGSDPELSSAFSWILGQGLPDSQKRKLGSAIKKETGKIYGQHRIVKVPTSDKAAMNRYRLTPVNGIPSDDLPVAPPPTPESSLEAMEDHWPTPFDESE